MEKKYTTAKEMIEDIGAERFRELSKKQREEFCSTIGKIVPELNKEIEEKKSIVVPIKDLAKKWDLDLNLEILQVFIGQLNFAFGKLAYMWSQEKKIMKTPY